MAEELKLEGLRKWFGGDRSTPRRFSDLWRLLLIQLANRTRSFLDEERRPFLERTVRLYLYDLSLVAEEEGIYVSHNDLQRVASYLEQHGWARISRRNPVTLSLTPNGLDEAEKILHDIDAVVFKRAPSNEPAQNLTELPQESAVPASDRFVQLDHNSSNYLHAVAQIEELIREASEIRINDWPEKEGVVEALKSGLNMIKAKYVNEAALRTTVYAAIGFILLKFAEAPIAELANRTWNAVKTLF